MPATFSRDCVRFRGCRDSMSAFGTIVVPATGLDSIVGAAPAVTVTLSSASGATSITTGPSAGIASTRTGRMYRPPGRTTRTSKGVEGVGSHVKFPDWSVSCDTFQPRTETSAPATGVPLSWRTTRPSKARALAADRIRSAAAAAARAARRAGIVSFSDSCGFMPPRLGAVRNYYQRS